MKRLSREERIGALTLAVVVLLIIGGAFWMRRCDRKNAADTAPVTILYQQTDTSASTVRDHSVTKIENNDSVSSRPSKHHKKREYGKTKKSKRIYKSNQTVEKNKQSRDPLTDTIPVRPKRNSQ